MPARVSGYRLLDGVALVTLRPSQIAQPILTLQDLAPGMVLAGTVAQVPGPDGEGPLVVSVAQGVRGVVPALHIAEPGTSAKARRGKAKVRPTAASAGTELSDVRGIRQAWRRVAAASGQRG